MTAIIPRPYQQSVISQVRAGWEHVARIIVVLPTGGGKTECAKLLTEGYSNPLCLAHTRVLVNQFERRTGCHAITIQAMRKRQQRGEGWPHGTPDLIVWDEIHHADSQDWQHLFEAIPDGTKMLGLTATPWRFSHGTAQKIVREVGAGIAVGGAKNNKHGQGLGDLFEMMIVGVTPKQLVESKYLVPLHTMNLVDAQDSAARIVGEVGPSYNEKRGKYTGRITAGSDIRLDPVDAWVRHGEGRKAMVFCHLVPAAERAAARFVERGVAASVVHGKLPPEVCEERLKAFAAGEYQVMCNVMQLTEGFDCPDVQCLVIDRGCNNLNTYVQVCGRGARTAPGKEDCLILDLTGCTAEHGHPQKDQDYWVVTSEGRAVSDLQCEVCGTRLSPMFPQRCMRCDPFRPKLGSPKELLDTGTRVYAALKDLRDAEDWKGLDKDAQDRRISDAMSAWEEKDATPQELAVRDHERHSAELRIEQRIEERQRLIREEQARKAREEQLEREREMYAKLTAEREQRRREWEAKQLEVEKARADAWQQQTKDFAAAQRASNERKEQPFSEVESAQIVAQLRQAFERTMRQGWTLGGAIKDVRNKLARFSGLYSPSSYDVPEAMRALLRKVQVDWPAGSETPAEYELRRMMADQRVSMYGRPWCRKKVRELFGVDGEPVSGRVSTGT